MQKVPCELREGALLLPVSREQPAALWARQRDVPRPQLVGRSRARLTLWGLSGPLLAKPREETPLP